MLRVDTANCVSCEIACELHPQLCEVGCDAYESPRPPDRCMAPAVVPDASSRGYKSHQCKDTPGLHDEGFVPWRFLGVCLPFERQSLRLSCYNCLLSDFLRYARHKLESANYVVEIYNTPNCMKMHLLRKCKKLRNKMQFAELYAQNFQTACHMQFACIQCSDRSIQFCKHQILETQKMRSKRERR